VEDGAAGLRPEHRPSSRGAGLGPFALGALVWLAADPQVPRTNADMVHTWGLAGDERSHTLRRLVTLGLPSKVGHRHFIISVARLERAGLERAGLERAGLERAGLERASEANRSPIRGRQPWSRYPQTGETPGRSS